MPKNKVIWTIRELTEVLRARQLNKFDCNLGVSGKRGNGKSTLLFKVFNSFKKDGFFQDKHQVYSQPDVIRLLAVNQFSFCWDDEAINSGYKRDFQKTGQKTLIKVITNYRDNFNIFASALPFFYSLDKDLRELIFCHIHIIERGMAVILLPLSNQIHESDPWDTKANIRIEQKEHTRLKKNPNLKFRYHKLTTFAGYIYFGKMTDKQEAKYKEIKKAKRARTFKIEQEEDEISFKERVCKLLIEGKLTKDGLIQICQIEGKKYSSTISDLNRLLKDKGMVECVTDLWRKASIRSINSNKKGSISDLVPDISL